MKRTWWRRPTSSSDGALVAFLKPRHAALLLLCASASNHLEASTWYVAKSGDDEQGDGRSLDTAFRTIPRGLEDLQAGDTLVVGPGTYYHSPLAIHGLSGTDAKPTTIKALRPGKTTISAAWEKAAKGKVKWKRLPESDIYEAEYATPAVYGGFGKYYLFRFESFEDLEAGSVVVDGKDGRKQTIWGPEYGFAFEDGTYYVKLPRGKNPRKKKLTFSLPTWGAEQDMGRGAGPVVRITQCPWLVLDGFRIVGSGTYGIIFDANSDHALVRNCVFEYCRSGVQLAHQSTVEWCEFSYPGFRRFSEHCRKRNGKLVTYELVKEYGEVRIEGGLASSTYRPGRPPSEYCEFQYNYIHDCFDGEHLGEFDDSESHHNVYEHCYDNSVQLESWTPARASRNLKFHHNLLLSCPNGHVSHQYEELVGPHWVYRNVIVGYDAHGWDPWTVVKSMCPKAEALHYYHNLIWVKSGALYWHGQDWEAGLANMHWRNNILVFEEDFEQPNADPFEDADHNILVAPAARPGLQGPGGQFLEGIDDVRFRNEDRLRFALRADSPAVDAGVRIEGFNDDAIGEPDVGPFERGLKPPGKNWPRPRRTVFVR